MNADHPELPADGGDGDGHDLEMLAAYATGELDPAGRDAVAEHLLDCNTCWQQLRVSRAATTAVQQLWEPAPAALRADLRAAILSAPTTRRARVQFPGLPASARARAVIAVAAAVILAAAGAVELVAGPHSGHHVAAVQLPDPVRAAVAQYSTPGDGLPVRAPVPDLTSIGLTVTSTAQTQVGGTSASRYTYRALHNPSPVNVLIALRAWPRPANANPIGTRSWIVSAHGLTVIGGPDTGGDQMLILAADHTTAMTAAATLGVI